MPLGLLHRCPTLQGSQHGIGSSLRIEWMGTNKQATGDEGSFATTSRLRCITSTHNPLALPLGAAHAVSTLRRLHSILTLYPACCPLKHTPSSMNESMQRYGRNACHSPPTTRPPTLTLAGGALLR